MDSEGNETVDHLHFFYDAQSKPAFVEYNGEMYRYVHNLQGDIIGIVDANGTLVVEYKYDAWGNSDMSAENTIGFLNPFRYRSYVWDDSAILYYLQNRYYSPLMCRFINEDNYTGNRGTLLSHSLFSYCQNNPIAFTDPNGCEAVAGTILGGVSGGSASGLGGALGGVFGILVGMLIGELIKGIVKAAKSLSQSKSRTQEEPKKYRLAIATGSNPVIPFGRALTKTDVYAGIISGLITKNSMRKAYDEENSGEPPRGRLRIGILSNSKSDAEELAEMFGPVNEPHPSHVEFGLPHYHIAVDENIHFWFVSE